MCTATLLAIRGTRIIVALSIRALFIVAAVAGVACYMLGEIGLL